ncbi:alanine--tRNA ligase-related protein [Candidatus Riesia pediculischaeffi]|uniref:Alanine--tRNA ligase n=1 Tax=Candidatus Riesia pediculischaeffi PTSU TaxID=1401651 RepID=A0A0C1S9R3_9ENTR|nr:alanine--tRNA ligase-related protein [Candidatus Riesia pediculischaeffi]KIE64026.1 Alanyl-tRNA synthetase [Candidatus Riesia pediculischaeffi PTSU]
MIKINTHKIRTIFLKFFQEKGHLILPSSSLVPDRKDSSLLFTNAGMNQFKKNFFDIKNSSCSTKVATAQRCIRAGGRFNDLENVGYTGSHHTLFEMLGNFSFGDYFKDKAIQYAWELLTSRKWFDICEDRIFVTVYHSDEESYDIWTNKIGISRNNIFKIQDYDGCRYRSENFWKMGDTGLCGPSTEVFYNFDNKGEFDGSLESFERNRANLLEIWNIVFIQFNLNSFNRLEQLPYFSIDTGMGLERMASVIQNVRSSYQIDIFQKLIGSIRSCFSEVNFTRHTLKVISDHIRSIVLIINENIVPSNVGRGYVLRKIIRRTIRKAYLDGMREPFLYKLVYHVKDLFEGYFQDISIDQKLTEDLIKREEKQFLNILLIGINLLKKFLKQSNYRIIHEKDVFFLYDTHGLPTDISMKICQEYGVTIDKNKLQKT